MSHACSCCHSKGVVWAVLLVLFGAVNPNMPALSLLQVCWELLQLDTYALFVKICDLIHNGVCLVSRITLLSLPSSSLRICKARWTACSKQDLWLPWFWVLLWCIQAYLPGSMSPLAPQMQYPSHRTNPLEDQQSYHNPFYQAASRSQFSSQTDLVGLHSEFSHPLQSSFSRRLSLRDSSGSSFEICRLYACTTFSVWFGIPSSLLSSSFCSMYTLLLFKSVQGKQDLKVQHRLWHNVRWKHSALGSAFACQWLLLRL